LSLFTGNAQQTKDILCYIVSQFFLIFAVIPLPAEGAGRISDSATEGRAGCAPR